MVVVVLWLCVVALLWCGVRRVVVRGDGRVSLCPVVVPWLLRSRVVVVCGPFVVRRARGWLFLGRGDMAVATIISALAVRIDQILMDLSTKCYCIGLASIHLSKDKNFHPLVSQNKCPGFLE